MSHQYWSSFHSNNDGSSHQPCSGYDRFKALLRLDFPLTLCRNQHGVKWSRRCLNLFLLFWQELWLSASRILCHSPFAFSMKLIKLESTSSTPLKCLHCFLNSFLQLLHIHGIDTFTFYVGNSRYPVPQRAETQGMSEEYFGCWMRDRKIPRDRIVFATKVSMLIYHLICR